MFKIIPIFIILFVFYSYAAVLLPVRVTGLTWKENLLTHYLNVLDYHGDIKG